MKSLLFTGSVGAAHGGDTIVIARTALPQADAMLIIWSAFTALTNKSTP
jgi:hypothetical protein